MPMKRVKYDSRRPKSWFIKRVGKEVIKGDVYDLFTVPVLIKSIGHAAAVHASQDKGYRYYSA